MKEMPRVGQQRETLKRSSTLMGKQFFSSLAGTLNLKKKLNGTIL